MSRRLPAALLLSAAAGLPLLTVAAGWNWYVDGPQLLLALVAGYAAGTWLPPRWAAVGVVLAAGALTLANQISGVEYHWLDDLVFFLVVVGGPAGAGAAATERARQVRRLERVSAEHAEQQRIAIAAARLEEQVRIQQKVHRRLTERITGIAIRAEGAQVGGGAAALGAIETEARGVLDDLREALGSLAGEETPSSAAEPEAKPRLTWMDVAIPGVVAAALGVETLLVDQAQGPAWANVVAAAIVAAPLVLRRQHAIAAVAATSLAGVAMSTWLTPIPHTVTGVGLMVLVFYTVGVWCRGRSWLFGWLLAALGAVAMETVTGGYSDGDGDSPLIVLIWAGGATLVGRITAGWQQRLQRIDELLAALDRDKDAAVRLATARERQALASDLHDTVAHAMTVVCVQAGAQLRAPGDPVDTLRTIRTTVTRSLTELREGLDEMATPSPLDRSRISALGRRMGVDLAVDLPAPSPAGAGAGLAFRVIREAVVNVARHAPGAAAHVEVEEVDHQLQVRISNGPGSAQQRLEVGSGTGLARLSASIEAAGGSLAWQQLADGGFEVRARIPQRVLEVAR